MTRWLATVLACGGVIAATATAPAAVAQLPEAGTESPAATIRQLANAGFDVQVNWVAGEPSNIPLSQCTVTGIDTSAPPVASVSINCPPDGSQ
ncbi:Uncharacterised protein [Mycolicibacterium aurum]|uniref:PASTA domain-containing protein n=1 Tax=Mycolicibacterium aurum TaxID=1791 RepID=A0A3S4SPP3_MYCAU|nr:hypothetical protein [Mycolicibacterium aurum]VEG57729.1 Uncharacterised protein [Mycolicibacterium aurum]